MECSICYDDITTEMFISICGHIYHNKCIKRWADTRKNCPMCRNTLRYNMNPPPINKPEEGKEIVCSFLQTYWAHTARRDVGYSILS